MANAWNNARNLAGQAVAFNRPVGNLAQEINEASWNMARNVAGEVASIENRPPPGAKPFDEFVYKVLRKEYTPDEITERPNGIGAGTVRDLVIRTIPKGTLLFTYSRRRDYGIEDTRLSSMLSFLYGIAVQQISYNQEQKAVEICLAKGCDDPQYFYPVPFASSGVNNYGPMYSFVIPVRLKQDVRVVYGKSGTEVLETMMSHKGNPHRNYNFKRVLSCDLVDGCTRGRRGPSPDTCLNTEFAAEQGLSGLCQISGQDVLGVIEDNEVQSGHYFSNSMQKIFRDIGDRIKQQQRLLATWDSDIDTKLAPLLEIESTYRIADNKLRELAVQIANYKNTLRLISILAKYPNPVNSIANVQKRLDEITNAKSMISNNARNALNALIKEEEKLDDLLEDLKRLRISKNRIASTSNADIQNKLEELETQQLELEDAIVSARVQYTQIQLQLIQYRRQKQSQAGYSSIEQLQAEITKNQNYLNMILLTLESEHRSDESYIGFPEYVFHPCGVNGYTGRLFVPEVSSDGLYTVDAEKSIAGEKQVVYVKPEHLQAFYQTYIAPQTIYEPLGLCTSNASFTSVNLDESFPVLPGEGNRTLAPYLLDSTMDYLLKTLRIPIAWDYRVNAWIDRSQTIPTRFLARFVPSNTYTSQFNSKLFTYPLNEMYQIPLTEAGPEGSQIPSLAQVHNAWNVKLIRLAFADVNPKSRRMSLIQTGAYPYPILLGPIYDSFSPQSQSMEENTRSEDLPSVNLLHVLLQFAIGENTRDGLTPVTIPFDSINKYFSYLKSLATVDETKPNDIFMGRYVPVQRAGRRKRHTHKRKLRRAKQTRHKKRKL